MAITFQSFIPLLGQGRYRSFEKSFTDQFIDIRSSNDEEVITRVTDYSYEYLSFEDINNTSTHNHGITRYTLKTWLSATFTSNGGGSVGETTYESYGETRDTYVDRSGSASNAITYSELSSYSYTISDTAGGISDSSISTFTDSASVSTTGVTSSIATISVSALATISRVFSSTSSVSTSVTYIDTSANGGGGKNTFINSVVSTRYTTVQATETTTYQGRYTTRTETRVNEYYLSTLINVVRFEDFSSINEWAFEPTTSSTGFNLLTAFATSRSIFSFSKHLTKEATLIGQSVSTSATFTGTDSGSTHTIATSVVTVTATTNQTSTWTSITSYNRLPFPVTSSTTFTELVKTTRTTQGFIGTPIGTTRTNSISIYFTRSAGIGVPEFTIVGEESVWCLTHTNTQRTDNLIIITTVSTYLSYHSSLVIPVTITASIGVRYLSEVLANTAHSQSSSYGDYLALFDIITSSSTVFPTSTNQSVTWSYGTTLSYRQTLRSTFRDPVATSFLAWNVTASPFTITALQPRVLAGFRAPDANAYSGSYGTSIGVTISGPPQITFIPFPFISRHQRVGVSQLITMPVTTQTQSTSTGTSGSTFWTLSYDVNSISLTHSQVISDFTGTDTNDETYLTNTTTLSAVFSVGGLITGTASTSFITSSTTLSTALASNTNTTHMQIVGGYAHVDSLQEALYLPLYGSCLVTKRPRAGGVDTVTTMALSQAHRLMSPPVSELWIISPIKIFFPTSSTANTDPNNLTTTFQKWLY